MEASNSPRSSAAPGASKGKSKRSTGHAKHPSFGAVIRSRRIDLDLTLEAVASRIKTSRPYVAHLESGNRRPSEKVVARLADVLGLDNGELFLLAKPQAQALLKPDRAKGSVWEKFRRNRQFQRVHNISNDEMEVLSRVVLLGEIHSSRDLIYVLKAVRHAVGR